ncbi:hypothetical protein FOG50_02210 [Hanseniaspora uvarum]|nr:hypothetical protein FOG50_02210 [Hanseniaspora uvarum]
MSSSGSVVLQNQGSYIPLSLITKQVETATLNEFEFFLYNLRSTNYISHDTSINDYSVFVNKIIKLLKSNVIFNSWKALQLINVLFTYNPIVLCSFSKSIINELAEKIEFMFKKTRLNKSQQSILFFKELMFTVQNLINLLRNKAILKREVLTPNLAPIIKILINKLPEIDNSAIIEIFVDFLKDILVNNTSVFKPYVNKYHSFLSGKLSKEGSIQDKIIENFVYCHLINLNYENSIEKNNGNNADTKHLKTNLGQVQWNETINAIFYEMKKIIALYQDILNIDEYTNKLINDLPEINPETESIFNFLPLLNLDFNQADSLFEINSRFQLLVKLLESFITLDTPFQVKFNSSVIINISNVVLNLQNFKLLKGLRKDTNVISCLSLNLVSLSYDVGLKLLEMLLTMKDGVYLMPFSKQIMSMLYNLLIPVFNQNKSNNKNTNTFSLNKVMTQKLNFVKLYRFLIRLSKSNEGMFISNLTSEDFETWNSFMNLAIILLKDDESLYFKLQNYTNTVDQQNNAGGKKKKNNLMKKTDTISDIYTSPQSFCFKKQNPSAIEDLYSFLIESIKEVRINTNVRSLIEKEAIVNNQFELMKYLVLNPSLESSNQSILPIVASKSSEDIRYWLKSIILPSLPQNFVQHYDYPTNEEQVKVEDEDMGIWEDDAEEEKKVTVDDEILEGEPTLKKQKITDKVVEISVEQQQNEANTVTPIQVDMSEKKEDTIKIVDAVQEEEEEDDGSDIEIPDLDLS